MYLPVPARRSIRRRRRRRRVAHQPPGRLQLVQLPEFPDCCGRAHGRHGADPGPLRLAQPSLAPFASRLDRLYGESARAVRQFNSLEDQFMSENLRRRTILGGIQHGPGCR